MIRFSTATAPFKWKFCCNFTLQVTSRSNLSLRNQLLSRDLNFVQFSDDRSELFKQLQEMIEMSKSFKEKEKDTEEDGNHIKTTRKKSSNKNSDLARFIEVCNTTSGGKFVNEGDTNVKHDRNANNSDEIVDILKTFEIKEAEDVDKGNDLDTNSGSHHCGSETSTKSDFLKELKSYDVSHENDTLEDTICRADINQARVSKTFKKPVTTKNLKCSLESFDTNLDGDCVQMILKVVLSQNLHLCPYTTVWLVSLISTNLSNWADNQKLTFMASTEFVKFLETLLIIIPNLNCNDILLQIYPFCQKLPVCFSDILFYQIFKVLEDEIHKMDEMNAEKMIEILRVIQGEKHVGMLDEVIHLLDEKLISLYKKDREFFFTLPLRHNLWWTIRGYADKEFRLKVLHFLAVLPNYTWVQHNISRKYGKILYSIDSNDGSNIKYLEDKYFKKVESLSHNLSSLDEVCDFIYYHGLIVRKGQTKIQRNLVNNIVNSILEQQNLPFDSVNKLVSGLQNLDYYSYKFAKRLVNFFISEWELIEKDILQYNKFLRMLVNHDCPSLFMNDWPHFKFLVENSSFLMNKSCWYKNGHNWLDLLDLANTLSCIKIFPNELLRFLSEKCNDKKTLNSPLKYLLRILQLNRAIHMSYSDFEFISKEMLVLIRQKVDELNNSLAGSGFDYSMSILEGVIKSIEMKTELNESVIMDCYTDFGQRIPLLMAFDGENKPYSLRKFKNFKNSLHIPELQRQKDIKLVAVLFFSDNAFLTSWQGISYLKVSHLQNILSLEFEGCHVEHFKYNDILNQSDQEKGSYIYEKIKNRLLNSSEQNR